MDDKSGIIILLQYLCAKILITNKDTQITIKKINKDNSINIFHNYKFIDPY